MELSASDYVQLLNIRTAKIVSLLLVLSFCCYHGLLLHWRLGVTPCKGLLVDGMYKGQRWQPWGCMMHDYTQGDTERCFRYNGFYDRRNRLAFVGDSRVRQMYQAMVDLVRDGKEPTEEAIPPAPARSNMTYENPALDLRMDFYWAPYANDSMASLVNSWTFSSSPTLLVLGSATHYIKNSNDSEAALSLYEEDLVILKEGLKKLLGTKVLWMLQPRVNERRLHVARKSITSASIDRYNAVAAAVLWNNGSYGGGGSGNNNLHLWSSLASLSQTDVRDFPDGIHFSARPRKQAAAILLNFACNDNMNFSDGSCCKSSDLVTGLQLIFFAFILACTGVTVLDLTYRFWCCRDRSYGGGLYLFHLLTASSNFSKANGVSYLESPSASSSGMRTVCVAFTRLGIVLCYFYVSDRTNLFMKENKYFAPLNFFLPLLYVTILGLFFNEETKGSRFLNRDQTDEWKGWMQLVILIYHVTGASQVLPIYMHVRVLVSSYIFLSAYGHFYYMWVKEDASLHRFLQVLFRMNFLTVVLCFAMNKNYQAYYFVPLITFWYTLQFIVMALPPRITAKSTEQSSVHYFYLVLKIVAVVAVISIFHMSEYLFEKFFLARPFKALFVSEDDDIREWWFRWKLDRYSMIYGFVFAFLTALCHRFRLLEDSAAWPSPNKAAFSFLMVISGLAGLLGYLVFALYCKVKEHCNEIHPYIVFVPIVSFIMLRNLFLLLRSRYSSFFAWFGRISLELFVAQFHIWLAADTHGVLVLIPNYPAVNSLLTAFVFVCAAHELHQVTAMLAPLFLPKEDRRIMLRNLVLFLAILVPIGVYDGMI